MDIDDYLERIPPSQSDRILREWGYDLVREYFLIAQQLPPVRSPVLELATGTGRMCAVLSCLFPLILSGDISLADLPRARQRIPEQFAERVHFMQLDMEHLPFRSDAFSAIVCMNTMHEVSNPHLCLPEMIRVIHPLGTLVVGDFNRTGFDAMQKVHNLVYQNDHEEGTFPAVEIEKVLSSSFHTIRSYATQLNVTFFAANKR